VGAIQERTFYPINITGKGVLRGDYLVVSKMDLNVGTEYVRLVTCTKFCSFGLQTLRSSVRSLYKLYEALFVCSTSSTFVRYVWSSSERCYDQYDRHKYDSSSNWWLKHPCYSDGPCTLKRYFFSQIINVLSTALILSYYFLWNA